MTSEKFGHYTSSVYLHNYINYEMSLSQKSIRNSESTSSTQEAVCMLGFGGFYLQEEVDMIGYSRELFPF